VRNMGSPELGFQSVTDIEMDIAARIIPCFFVSVSFGVGGVSYLLQSNRFLNPGPVRWSRVWNRVPLS